MNWKKNKSLIAHLGLAAVASTSIPISNYLWEERERSIEKIIRSIKDFDGNPEVSQADWEILYSKLGGAYTSKHRPGLYLQSLYEIEERLPQVMEEMRR